MAAKTPKKETQQPKKKLKLNKESLKKLTNEDLQKAQGGAEASDGLVCDGYWRVFTR